MIFQSDCFANETTAWARVEMTAVKLAVARRYLTGGLRSCLGRQRGGKGTLGGVLGGPAWGPAAARWPLAVGLVASGLISLVLGVGKLDGAWLLGPVLLLLSVATGAAINAVFFLGRRVGPCLPIAREAPGAALSVSVVSQGRTKSSSCSWGVAGLSEASPWLGGTIAVSLGTSVGREMGPPWSCGVLGVPKTSPCVWLHTSGV